MIYDIITKAFEELNNSGASENLRFSTSNDCSRKLYYIINGYKEKNTNPLNSAIGTIFHSFMEKYAFSNNERFETETKVSLTMNNITINGSIDLYDKVENVNYDFKFINGNKWNLLKARGAHQYDRSTIWQQNLYIKAKKAKKATVIYVNLWALVGIESTWHRGIGNVYNKVPRRLDIYKEDIFLDDTVISQIFYKYKKILEAKENQNPPEIPEEYKADKFPCAYCGVSYICRK